MPVCIECKKEVVKDYQEIITQRKTKIYICNECLKKYRRDNARDSK